MSLLRATFGAEQGYNEKRLCSLIYIHTESLRACEKQDHVSLLPGGSLLPGSLDVVGSGPNGKMKRGHLAHCI